jgi:hypothetical protein
MLLKCAQSVLQLHILLNVLLQQLVSDTIFPGRLIFLRCSFEVGSFI